MPVFRRNNAGRDVVTQNFFDDLRHLCAGFAGADNDNSPVNRNALSSDPKHSVFQRNEFSDACGRICCIQSSFPDQPRRMTQFFTIHSLVLLDGYALLLVGGLHALADSVAHFLDAGAVCCFRILLQICVEILDNVGPSRLLYVDVGQHQPGSGQ